MTVDRLSITASEGRGHVPFLRTYLARAVPLIPAAPGEVGIALVGDAEMSALHDRFLGTAGPTDVLTFELDHDRRGRCTAGEVVVCVPEARRQARRRGIPARHELLLYAVHGLLHLSGFDDRTAPAYRKMHAMEDRLLTRLGVGPVFGAASPGPARPRGGCPPQTPVRRRPTPTAARHG